MLVCLKKCFVFLLSGVGNGYCACLCVCAYHMVYILTAPKALFRFLRNSLRWKQWNFWLIINVKFSWNTAPFSLLLLFVWLLLLSYLE